MAKTYLVTESEHYIFHYLPNTLAEQEINQIIFEQEKSFKKITDLLNVMPDFKINYHLLNTAEEVGIEYGVNQPCNGFARKPHDIYAVYNQEVKCIGPHEDAHIISYLISIPNYGFIREGIAMYFDQTQCGKANELWVKEYLKNGQYLKVKDLLDDEYFYKEDSFVTYPIAGAFTRYLIETLGKMQYIELYAQGDFSLEKLKSYLKCEDVDETFIKWINQRGE